MYASNPPAVSRWCRQALLFPQGPRGSRGGRGAVSGPAALRGRPGGSWSGLPQGTALGPQAVLQVGHPSPPALNVLQHKGYFPQVAISLEIAPDVQGQVVWQLHATYMLCQRTVCHLSSVPSYRHSPRLLKVLSASSSPGQADHAAQIFALHLVQALPAEERAAQSRGCH